MGELLEEIRVAAALRIGPTLMKYKYLEGAWIGGDGRHWWDEKRGKAAGAVFVGRDVLLVDYRGAVITANAVVKPTGLAGVSSPAGSAGVEGDYTKGGGEDPAKGVNGDSGNSGEEDLNSSSAGDKAGVNGGDSNSAGADVGSVVKKVKGAK